MNPQFLGLTEPGRAGRRERGFADGINTAGATKSTSTRFAVGMFAFFVGFGPSSSPTGRRCAPRPAAHFYSAGGGITGFSERPRHRRDYMSAGLVPGISAFVYALGL